MPIQVDDDPQPEDVERFSSDVSKCPKCKAEIYDDAEWCHKCGTVLGGQDTKPPAPLWLVLTSVAIIIAILVFLKFW
jgi:hypothetical protein